MNENIIQAGDFLNNNNLGNFAKISTDGTNYTISSDYTSIGDLGGYYQQPYTTTTTTFPYYGSDSYTTKIDYSDTLSPIIDSLNIKFLNEETVKEVLSVFLERLDMKGIIDLEKESKEIFEIVNNGKYEESR